jgi:plastocyanin
VSALRASLTALAMALSFATAVANATEPREQAARYSVELARFMFTPTVLTVPAGATVRWQNLDGEPHTVVSLDGLFRSGALDQGDSFEFTFSKPGSYRYVCSIHPRMAGTIVVTAPQ